MNRILNQRLEQKICSITNMPNCSIELLHCTAKYFGQTPHHNGVLPFNIECVRRLSFLEYVIEMYIRQNSYTLLIKIAAKIYKEYRGLLFRTYVLFLKICCII